MALALAGEEQLVGIEVLGAGKIRDLGSDSHILIGRLTPRLVN